MRRQGQGGPAGVGWPALLEWLALSAALLTIIWAPLYEGSTFGVGLLGLTLLGAVTVSLTLLTLLVKGQFQLRSPFWALLVLGLLAWVWASTGWAANALEALRWAGVWTAVLGTALSLHVLCTTRRRRGTVLAVILLTGAAAVVIALLQARGITIPGAQVIEGVPENFLTGPYFHPSHFSGSLIPVAALTTSVLLFTRLSWHSLPLLALQGGVQYVNLQTDGSSIPAVILAGALPLLVWVWTRRAWVGAVLTVLALAGAVGGASLIVTPQGQAQFNQDKARLGIRSQNLEGFLAIRRNIHQFGDSLWRAHPVRGVGVGQFVTEFQVYRQPYRADTPSVDQQFVNYAHSDYYQMLSELGSVGLALFLLVLLSSVLKRAPGVAGLAWCAALPAFVITGFYDSHLTAIPGTMLTAFALSALPARSRPGRTTSQPELSTPESGSGPHEKLISIEF